MTNTKLSSAMCRSSSPNNQAAQDKAVEAESSNNNESHESCKQRHSPLSRKTRCHSPVSQKARLDSLDRCCGTLGIFLGAIFPQIGMFLP